MATQTHSMTRRSTPQGGAGGIEATLERLLEPALAIALAVAALLAVLPLLVVALPVSGALYALRTRHWAIKGAATLVLCAVPALTALLWALIARGEAPVDPVDAITDAAGAYVAVQLDAGAALIDAWQAARADGEALDWRGEGLRYAGAVWPYALMGGPLLALAGWVAVAIGCVPFGSAAIAREGEAERKPKPLRLRGADELARLPAVMEEEQVRGLVARGRLTAITALPKRGKTVAYFGLLRARQDGGAWFGRTCRPGKTLVLTEEDAATFAAKVRD
ncbi:MAG: AAA family ATPase, partial [Chloroflexota bacterium]